MVIRYIFVPLLYLVTLGALIKFCRTKFLVYHWSANPEKVELKARSASSTAKPIIIQEGRKTNQITHHLIEGAKSSCAVDIIYYLSFNQYISRVIVNSLKNFPLWSKYLFRIVTPNSLNRLNDGSVIAILIALKLSACQFSNPRLASSANVLIR